MSAPAQPGEPWNETVLWNFGANGDGQYPLSRLVFDVKGNLYGTTSQGGSGGFGTVFQLVPPKSGTDWSENILYPFGADHLGGGDLRNGVTFDAAGNLYGTTLEGGSKEGSGLGVIYKLTPSPQLPWIESVLFRFTKESGGNPLSVANFDQLGNLYVTASAYGPAGFGSVLRFTPQGHVRKLAFLGSPDGAFPGAGVLLQGSTVYGTTQMGGTQNGGTLFKIQGTTETVLYSFCSQPKCADGSQPQAALISDNKASLFGTTWFGGANGKGGVVFQISMPAPSRPKTVSRKTTHAPKIQPVAATSSPARAK